MNNIDKLIRERASAFDKGDAEHVAKLIDVIIQSGVRNISQLDEVLRRIRAEIKFFNDSYLSPKTYDKVIGSINELGLDEISLAAFKLKYESRWNEKAPGRVIVQRVGEISGQFKLKRLSNGGPVFLKLN